MPPPTIDTITVEPNHAPPQKDRGRDSEPRQDATEMPEAEEKLRKLQDENLGLKIDNAGKQMFISQLVSEREGLMTTARDLSYRLGAAEAQVAQLSAPKPPADVSRPDATVTEHPAVASEIVTEAAPTTPASTSVVPEMPAPEPSRPSLMRRVFG